MALPVEDVERIVAAVEFSPLVDPHPSVVGVVNVGGEGALLYDLRRRFGEHPRELGVDDRFILVRHGGLRVLWVDSVVGVARLARNLLSVMPEGDSSVSMAFGEEGYGAVMILSKDDLFIEPVGDKKWIPA